MTQQKNYKKDDEYYLSDKEKWDMVRFVERSSQDSLIIGKIKQIIMVADGCYPSEIQKQANLIKYHLDDLLGQQCQVFINRQQKYIGYRLYSTDSQFYKCLYKGKCYLLWKVILDQSQL